MLGRLGGIVFRLLSRLVGRLLQIGARLAQVVSRFLQLVAGLLDVMRRRAHEAGLAPQGVGLVEQLL